MNHRRKECQSYQGLQRSSSQKLHVYRPRTGTGVGKWYHTAGGLPGQSLH